MSKTYYDVNPMSELKDHLIGTEEGERYLKAVASGEREPDCTDNPLDVYADSSHVTAYHIYNKGKYVIAGKSSWFFCYHSTLVRDSFPANV